MGTVSTNVFLRRAHNFALDMGWLPWSVVLKRQWPVIEFKEESAITWKEHCQIIERENNQNGRKEPKPGNPACMKFRTGVRMSITPLGNLLCEAQIITEVPCHLVKRLALRVLHFVLPK